MPIDSRLLPLDFWALDRDLPYWMFAYPSASHSKTSSRNYPSWLMVKVEVPLTINSLSLGSKFTVLTWVTIALKEASSSS